MALKGRKTHARLMCGAAILSLTLAAGAAWAQESAEFNIEPQSLASALNEFAVQSPWPILYTVDQAASKATPGVTGVKDPETALAAMLNGTGLTYRREGDTLLIVQAGEGGASPQDAGANGGNAVEALIVTAQKKEEQIQDVPIAISAFTQKSLDAQKLEGGFDLLKAIPNVSFSKNNFSGYNFSIRGIGTKAVSATTDPGVAVSFNNTTLIVNRLFEQEYFDVERVEVLRGPQGTLYGRNATSGVINVLSARPRLGEFEGDIEFEAGNFNARRVRGMVNIPVGDTLAIRAAGALTKRDGYGVNLAAGTPDDVNGVSADVDGRDLWSSRVTVGWEPVEQIRVNALWEHFEEDDNRARTSKQLCHRDPEYDFDTFDWATSNFSVIQSGQTSQSCQAGSLYDDAAFGTPNGASLPYVAGLEIGTSFAALGGIFAAIFAMGPSPYYPFPDLVTFQPGPPADTPRCARDAVVPSLLPVNICFPDPYGGMMQPRDLRTIHSLIEPVYRASADIFELSVDIDLSDALTFTSQTVYATDEYYASQDFNRFTSVPIFSDSDLACGGTMFGQIPFWDCSTRGTWLGGAYNVTPGGVYDDPQLGKSNSLMGQDLSQAESDQFNQEFRLVSNFDTPFNFSLGSNFTRFETMNDYYVFINALTLATHFFPFNTVNPTGATNISHCGTSNENYGPTCIYVDPNPLDQINGEGHNYFRSANPYELTSSALFGEFYWQATDALKVTLGARMTWDRKVFTPIPSQLLLRDYRRHVPEGAGPEDCNNNEVCPLSGTGVDTGEGARGSPANPDIVQEWREPTGRIIVDWKPDLPFTDETMIYGSISHGYKGGGANPPTVAWPAGLFLAQASGGAAPPTFEPEFIDAFEIGTKNTLLDGALILNGAAFYYDYKGYQVSKIVDRSAANENFDSKVWGAELEWIFSPTRNLRFNGTVGHLRTEIADGERSIDLMDRTAGGDTSWTASDGTVYDEWMVLKPFVTRSSNCVAPVELVEMMLLAGDSPPDVGPGFETGGAYQLTYLCPGGNVMGNFFQRDPAASNWVLPDGRRYEPRLDAPGGGAGFSKELGGNELPNAPHWTASLGAQYRMALPGGWDGTLRGDFYWQSQSFARVYNTQYDKLRAWTNTNISLWFEQPEWGVTAEVYVKNVFDETPITDAFLNSDDSGLTTNVFTLDPRLVGVSVRKTF